jgi:hypothetical protein
MVAAIWLTLSFVNAPHKRTVLFKNPNAITSAMLVEEPNRYDGTTVTFMGEAVVGRMVRGMDEEKGAWLHLNDDAYMYNHIGDDGLLSGYNSGMPVWVEDASLTDAIEYYGAYKSSGDKVEVTGVYHSACAEHGGDTDIHAGSLRIVERGRPTAESVASWKFFLSAALLLMALLMFLMNRRSTHRELAGLFHRERR